MDGALDGVAAGLAPPSDFGAEEDDEESLLAPDFAESLDVDESLDFESARESLR